MPLSPPAHLARLACLALPALLAACADGPTSVYVGDRRVFTTAAAPAAPPTPTPTPTPTSAAAAPGAPAAEARGGFSLPRLTLATNIPVYLGDRLISPGTPDPDD